MGFWDNMRRRRTSAQEARPPQAIPQAIDKPDVVVGAKHDMDEVQVQSFNNSNITFNGNLAGYDYDAILRDKQTNIDSLYKLADYYVDADAIVRGIVRHIFVPYSSNSPWFLSGAKDKTCKLYEDHYKKMHLSDKIEGIFYEYWKYGNVFPYIFKGHLITLPVHKCKIGNVALNGRPLVEYDCQSILNEWRSKSYSIRENWIRDNNLESYFKGFPEEIVEALNKGHQYAQLNPDNCFPFQGPKESWQRYSVPFIASCLPALAKKELISQYEDAVLNLGIRSFVHVQYGDKNKGQDMLPGAAELTQVRQLFQKGMSGFPLVVTNHLASAQVVQAKLDDLFQWDKYKDVNQDILSAGGVSGILVSGVSEDGSTFASAQVSMNTAAARIDAARREFCEIMNQINERLKEDIAGTYNLKETPKFSFKPLDMAGQKALRESCQMLWEKGLVSTRTMMETQGYSLDVERTQREQEAEDGTDEALVPRDGAPAPDAGSTEGTGKVGRPQMDDDERHSDPDAAQRGKQPKPSNEDGSMPEDGS